jgi:CrcB protein
MAKWTCLAVGSLVGGFARYLFAGAVYELAGTGFPHGTLAVNLSGCFLIGLFNALAEEKFLLGPDARVLLMIGFCGAYTTFSTLLLETSNLLKDGELNLAAANIAISVVLGLALLRAGELIGRAI